MNKKDNLNDLVCSIEKQHGKGSAMTLSCQKRDHVSALSTGHFSLDCAIGIGGIPVGKITEIYGPESSGKTTLALKIAAQATQAGQIVAFIDVEHALDMNYAISLGVKTDYVLFSQPDNGEQALDIVESLIRSEKCDVIIVDSVAALVTKAEIEGNMGVHTVGGHARLMSQALKKLNAQLDHKTSLIFLNQLRMKVGVLFGNPEITTGGNALKFFASLRMEVRRSSLIKDQDRIIGHVMKVKIVKNKVAPPMRQAEIDILYKPQPHICPAKEIIDVGMQCGLIITKGGWYYYGDQKIGHGKEKAQTYLAQSLDLMNEIKNKISELI